MRNLIAVTHGPAVMTVEPIKRMALLFDQISIVGAKRLATDAWEKANPDTAADLKWLMEQNIVLEAEVPPMTESTDETRYHLDSMTHQIAAMMKLAADEDEDADAPTFDQDSVNVASIDIKKALQIGRAMVATSGSYVRLISIILRSNGIDAHAVLERTIPSANELPRANVIEVVFSNIPMPNEDTSWEQILEYRSDPDSKEKFLDLRNWITELARAKLSAAETEEKLEYVMSQYQRHLRLHKMKTNANVFETIIVSSAEMLENVAKLKFGQAAKTLFSVRQRRIALLEVELTSPGSEVAYLLKAKETFSK